jgi:hypothetical protein
MKLYITRIVVLFYFLSCLFQHYIYAHVPIRHDGALQGFFDQINQGPSQPICFEQLDTSVNSPRLSHVFLIKSLEQYQTLVLENSQFNKPVVLIIYYDDHTPTQHASSSQTNLLKETKRLIASLARDMSQRVIITTLNLYDNGEEFKQILYDHRVLDPANPRKPLEFHLPLILLYNKGPVEPRLQGIQHKSHVEHIIKEVLLK